MRHLPGCVPAAFSACVLLATFLQAASPQQQAASISGRLTEVGSDRPIPAATIELLAPGAASLRTSTDGQGTFAFDNLPAGSYFLKASKNGFLDSDGGVVGVSLDSRTRVDLLAATDRRTVPLELCRAASISGVVRDDSGDPIAGVRVRLLKRSPDGRTHVTEAVDETDDRGEYRFGGLAPNTYVVVVPSTLTTFPNELDDYGSYVGKRRVGDIFVRHLNELPVHIENGRVSRVYPTTYLGGATTLSSATAAAVQCGDDRPGADISLTAVRSGSVSGVTLVDGQPLGLAAVRLVSLEESVASLVGLEAGMTVTSRNGRFKFEGIPFGSYELRVLHYPVSDNPMIQMEAAEVALRFPLDQQHTGRDRKLRPPVSAPTLFGMVPVTVSEKPVGGLRIELSPIARVSGQVEFKGTLPSPGFETLRVFVELIRVDGPTRDLTKPGWVTPQGTFTTQGSPPGRYLIQVVGDVPGWTAQSVLLGLKDLSLEPFELGTKDLAGLRLRFTDQVSTLSGTVRNRLTGAEGTILLFPADASLWQYAPLLSNRFRAVRSSETGSYEFSSVLPGDYFLVALPHSETAVVHNAEKFRELSAFATRIRVTEGAKIQQDLTLREK